MFDGCGSRLDAYDRIIGLDLSEVAIGLQRLSLHKAPCGGVREPERTPTDRAKLG